jgi:hypothetical protein
MGRSMHGSRSPPTQTTMRWKGRDERRASLAVPQERRSATGTPIGMLVDTIPLHHYIVV